MTAPLTDACCPHTLRITSYGVRVEIRASSGRLLRRLQQQLPPLARPTNGVQVGRVFAVRAQARRCACGVRHDTVDVQQGRVAASTAGTDAAIDAMRIWVKQYVATLSPRRVFAHAGVVAIDGWAVIVPGHSMSGKTTLIAALLRAGAAYLSDEFAVVDRHGLIHPYHQPLGLRELGGAAQTNTSAQRLGALHEGPARAGLVVVTQYRPDATWTPRTLSRADTVMALLEHTLPARRTPARALDALTRATADAVGLRGVRGDADETARRIVARLRALNP